MRRTAAAGSAHQATCNAAPWRDGLRRAYAKPQAQIGLWHMICVPIDHQNQPKYPGCRKYLWRIIQAVVQA
jgi:hypothetical protein